MKALLILFLLGACLAITAQGQSTALEWVEKNAPLFHQMLKTLNMKVPPKTVATVLVPSDKAIESFLSGMKLSKQEFLNRQGLVDLVLAYHVIPGYQAKETGNVPHNPTIAVTADVNYMLRFYKDPKTSRVWVQDVQDNNVTLPKAPIILNTISIVPIDKVLMSGAYFFNGLDALKHYPQWTDAFDLAKKAGWPTDDDSADLTFFVPDNAALKARMSTSLPAAEAKQQLLYHFVAPARHIPDQLKPGKLPTMLKGHDLTVAISKRADGVPNVQLTPEVGPTASVNIYNIYAGKGILQGIDSNLQAKLTGGSQKTVQEKSSSNTKPGRHHRRSMLQALFQVAASSTTPAAASASSSSSSHLLLLGRSQVRALLRYGHSSDNGFNQMTANSIAATNTQQAIYAAANGNIPVGAATRYGSYQAQAAAEYSNGCYNCRNWVG